MVDLERLRMLTAMGIDVYELRSRVLPSAAPSQRMKTVTQSTGPDVSTAPRLVIVCAQDVRRDARFVRLFAQLPQALGVTEATIEWIETDARGALASPPSAPAYLVFGAAMARALGVQLSTMQQNSSIIAVTAEPAQLPGSAADKRALWQVLKPLAQRLRA